MRRDGLGVAVVRVGGREYPAVTVRNCKICSSAHRYQIESEAVGGRSWKSIASSLPDDANITTRNVADHFRNDHLPVTAEATRQLADRQARQRGEVVAVGAGRVVDYLDFARSLVGRVNERLVAGEIEPGVSDGLRAVDLLGKYDPGPDMAADDYAAVFQIYARTARAIMTPEQTRQFVEALDNNIELQRIASKWDEVHANTHPG